MNKAWAGGVFQRRSICLRHQELRGALIRAASACALRYELCYDGHYWAGIKMTIRGDRYSEIRPSGHFRFVNFRHPPPLIFSAEYGQ
jgi:hypothetical protein